MADKTTLLLYGLQRSGTNYLEALLKKQYRVRFLNSAARNHPRFKHFRLYDDKAIIPHELLINDYHYTTFGEFEQSLDKVPNGYLVLSKDPYSWLLSYRRWAKKCQWPPVSYHYIEEYNLFHEKWVQFARETDKVLLVRYIDLLRNPGEQIEQLADAMSITKRRRPSFLTRVANVSQSTTFTQERKDFYLNKRYLEQYSSEQLADLNARLNLAVMQSLGYEMEQPN